MSQNPGEQPPKSTTSSPKRQAPVRWKPIEKHWKRLGSHLKSFNPLSKPLSLKSLTLIIHFSKSQKRSLRKKTITPKKIQGSPAKISELITPKIQKNPNHLPQELFCVIFICIRYADGSYHLGGRFYAVDNSAEEEVNLWGINSAVFFLVGCLGDDFDDFGNGLKTETSHFLDGFVDFGMVLKYERTSLVFKACRHLGRTTCLVHFSRPSPRGKQNFLSWMLFWWRLVVAISGLFGIVWRSILKNSWGNKKTNVDQFGWLFVFLSKLRVSLPSH